MKKRKILLRIICILLAVLLVGSLGAYLYLKPGGPIKNAGYVKDCPPFYGTVAEANPLESTQVPQHPLMAPEGTNGMHGNTYNTGTYNYNCAHV